MIAMGPILLFLRTYTIFFPLHTKFYKYFLIFKTKYYLSQISTQPILKLEVKVFAVSRLKARIWFILIINTLLHQWVRFFNSII